jgi:hypothetical protein
MIDLPDDASPRLKELAKPDIRALKIAKLKRLNENRYKYYVPNGRGETFLRTVGSGAAFITLYSAANGVGKTAAGVNLLANLIWPIQDFVKDENGNKVLNEAGGHVKKYVGHQFIQGPLFESWPYLKRIRIVSDPQVVQSIIREMKHWFPRGRYTTTKGRKSYEAEWKTDTGWEIDIMTYDQDPKEFESANLGLIWCDEPPTQTIYKALIARLRRGGHMFITATPLKGSEWMYDEIILNQSSGAGSRVVIESNMEDACKEHGVRGHLEHKHIEQIIANYTEDEKQARVYGKFQHLTGLVFKQFDPKIHVIKPFHINKRDFTVYHYLDPHPRTPDAGLWCAVDRKGNRFVIDEIFLKCQNGDSELAARIIEKNEKYRIGGLKIDPSAAIKDQHRDLSLSDSLAAYGLYYTPASKKREAADRAIANALSYSEVGGNMLQPPGIYIFDTCQRLIWEMSHYRWDDWSGKNADKHGAKQKPLDKDDHCIENLGRFLFDEQPFISYIEAQETHEEPNDDPYA